jgi:hypothetical protein
MRIELDLPSLEFIKDQPVWLVVLVCALVWYFLAGLVIKIFFPMELHSDKAGAWLFSPLLAVIFVVWTALSVISFGCIPSLFTLRRGKNEKQT